MKDNDQYPSKYSNGKSVSAAQYITELICENKARKDGVDLHYRFWNHPKWAKFFRNQIASAHKLLKKYDIIPIIKSLKSEKGQRIFSLRAPHLPEIIDKEVVKYKMDTKVEPQISRTLNPTTKKYNSNKKNILSILEEIDNGDQRSCD